jgi:methylisocitrate lyase
VSQLADVGVNLVIWPVSLLRIAMGAADRALDTLRADGSLESLLPVMQHRTDLYDLMDYAGYTAFDASIFDVTGPLPGSDG